MERFIGIGVVTFNSGHLELAVAPDASPGLNFSGCGFNEHDDIWDQSIPRRHMSGLQFDLKNADIVLSEGTIYTGTVTSPTAIGDVTVAVTLPSGTMIPVGFPLLHSANTEYVTVTAVTNTLGTTTKVTVAPPVAAVWAGASTVVFGPHQLFVHVGKGNLTYTEHKQREYTLNRGKIDEVRDGDEQPIDLSFTFNWDFLTTTTGDLIPTMEDFLKFRNLAAAFKSSDTTQPCRPKSVDVSIRNSPICTGIDKEWITIPFFRYEQLQHDATAGNIACTGKSNALEATTTRVIAFPLSTAY